MTPATDENQIRETINYYSEGMRTADVVALINRTSKSKPTEVPGSRLQFPSSYSQKRETQA